VRHRPRLLLAAALLLGLLPLSPATATEGGQGLSPVANIPFEGGEGTDSDFITMDIDPGPATVTRRVGVFGSIDGGARILDVTNRVADQAAADAAVLGTYDCRIGQGDVQLFQRPQADGSARTYFAFTRDNTYGLGGVCADWLDTEYTGNPGNRLGTFIVEITDPANPTTVQFVPFPKGSHNMTVHPSTNYLYNSNSELITNAPAAAIEIYDIRNLANPVSVGSLRLPANAGLGVDSHDITFSADGRRAYSAALASTHIIDTTDPAKPRIISTIDDPAINVDHQADPVTITHPVLGKRTFLLIEDEFAGAAGAEQTCPSGGTHVWDITNEAVPVKVGAWFIDDVTNTNATGLRSCTAHVFDIDEANGLMTMSFYGGGVRVVDLTNLVGVALGGRGAGMREIAFHRFNNSNSWSFKVGELSVDGNRIRGTIYSNDITRGIDVYALDVTRTPVPVAEQAGRWVSAADLSQLPAATLTADSTPYCLLQGRTPAQAAADLAVALAPGI
jgi:hypothetical protein